MKIKVLFVFAAALLFSLPAGTAVSASGIISSALENAKAAFGGPVGGIQVIIQQDPEGYRGARPTDESGAAAFANMEAGKYTISLKRFSKAGSAYNVSIKSSKGAVSSTVWEATKKDSHKASLTLTGDDPQMVTISVATTDAAAAPVNE